MQLMHKLFGGHWNIGKRITVYGLNAMQWGVNIHTKRWGYVCFRLPLPCFGRFPRLYLYVSPNATPWASTLCIGKGAKERAKAIIRRKTFGHNFDSWNNERINEKLQRINNIV
jgi:hypothetical protein